MGVEEPKVRENCGFFVAYNVDDTYNGLSELQNRGRETAGIGVRNSHCIDTIKLKWLVNDFSFDDINKFLQGDVCLGHLRYSTSGSKDNVLTDAHPHVFGGREHKYSNHIIIRGSDASCVHNGTISYDHLESVDNGDLNTGCDTEAFLQLYKKIGIKELMKTVPGAYSAAIFDNDTDQVIVFRDRFGIRPCWLGQKGGRYVAASEDSAITAIGGDPIREIKPGEVVFLESGKFTTEQVVEPDLHGCFFELNYLLRKDSSFIGTRAWDVRYRLGVQLGREFHPEDADIVTYVPHSPQPIALGYNEITGIPFVEVFYKRKKERSFQGPFAEERKNSIKHNLHLLDNVGVSGKVVVVAEDSLVRGNVSEEAARILLEAGAKDVYIISGTPPIGPEINGVKYGCLFGVDMPPNDDFAIRRYGSAEGIAQHIGAKEVYYISLDGMVAALGIPEDKLCTYCIGGEHPFYSSRAIQIAGYEK